jgi:hypothetical protein
LSEPTREGKRLAIAGYHPATLAVAPGTGVTYDYWMFEGLRASNNKVFWDFAAACRNALARVEAEQTIL